MAGNAEKRFLKCLGGGKELEVALSLSIIPSQNIHEVTLSWLWCLNASACPKP